MKGNTPVRYNKVGTKNPIARFIYNKYKSNLQELIKSLPIHNVLEIGCGRGEILNYSLNSLSLCQEWLDLGAVGTEIGITTYHEIRPFVLMRCMELSGDLSLLSLIKTKLITSRTKGTSIESEVSVYAFE